MALVNPTPAPASVPSTQLNKIPPWTMVGDTRKVIPCSRVFFARVIRIAGDNAIDNLVCKDPGPGVAARWTATYLPALEMLEIAWYPGDPGRATEVCWVNRNEISTLFFKPEAK